MEKVYGIMHGVVETKRLIAIKENKRVKYFYMSKGMFKNFMMYFQYGIYVFLTVTKKPRIYRGYLVQNIISIDKVLSPNKNNPKIYYDISIIKSGVKTLVNNDRNKVFIDFEMSMPPYTNYKTFQSEIIQVGYVLVDKNGYEIERYSSYIKPKLFPKISKRTEKFLHIEQDSVSNGIDYTDFYYRFKKLNMDYNPMIFVWGKNDQLELNKMNKIYRLRKFNRNVQFVDLLNLHKIYFRLKNDIGLFNAYNLYSDEDLSSQKHDALEDALVTKEIFANFKRVCNNIIQVNIE
jgi:sporulation inhibitor KapD